MYFPSDISVLPCINYFFYKSFIYSFKIFFEILSYLFFQFELKLFLFSPSFIMVCYVYIISIPSRLLPINFLVVFFFISRSSCYLFTLIHFHSIFVFSTSTFLFRNTYKRTLTYPTGTLTINVPVSRNSPHDTIFVL